MWKHRAAKLCSMIYRLSFLLSNSIQQVLQHVHLTGGVGGGADTCHLLVAKDKHYGIH